MVLVLVLTTDTMNHLVLGTSLCAMVPLAMVGTYAHAMGGNVHWRTVPCFGGEDLEEGRCGTVIFWRGIWLWMVSW